jgi:4-methyl-5(b-hydroxyethyl)-thiazole monophosphate biosynthesis
MVYMFLANGFEEIEALCPLDLLRRAGVEVTTVGIGGDMIRGAHGITVQADIPEGLFADAAPEMVILPGGMPGSKNLDESRTVDTVLKVAARRGAYIAAICAAPMVFGALGIVRGRKATIYPGMEEELKGADVTVSEEVVTDGHVTTSRGAGTAIPFALRLIEILCGADTAENVKKGIVFQTTPVL